MWAGIVVTVAFYFFPWFNWPFAMSWLYLWARDTINARRDAKKKEAGRVLKVVVKDGKADWTNDLTTEEISAVFNNIFAQKSPAPQAEA